MLAGVWLGGWDYRDLGAQAPTATVFAVQLQNRYYGDKMHALTAEDRRAVLEHYVAGLHWVLEYYYRGVASWDWYYPYHYAPMASDMVNLDSIQVGTGRRLLGRRSQGHHAVPHQRNRGLHACSLLPCLLISDRVDVLHVRHRCNMRLRR